WCLTLVHKNAFGHSRRLQTVDRTNSADPWGGGGRLFYSGSAERTGGIPAILARLSKNRIATGCATNGLVSYRTRLSSRHGNATASGAFSDRARRHKIVLRNSHRQQF